jgi:Mg-chelatase subunit ChlD
MNVYILLDRSGSMATLWNEAIGSINGYVGKLKKSDKVHLAVFDSVSHDVIRDVKASEWIPVSDQEIQPRGGTPLYDSCGKIMAAAEESNAKKTVLVVMTDGEENASKEHSQTSIMAKVKAFEDKKWEVIFLGANFDAVESVSGSVGVVGSKTMNISVGNLARGFDTLSTYTNAYAATGASINFSLEDKLSVTSK